MYPVRLLRLVAVGNTKPPRKVFHAPNRRLRPLLAVIVFRHLALFLRLVRHGRQYLLYHNVAVVVHFRLVVRHYQRRRRYLLPVLKRVTPFTLVLFVMLARLKRLGFAWVVVVAVVGGTHLRPQLQPLPP